MSKNKRVPKELQKYVVVVSQKTRTAARETYHYCSSQKEAKEWARDMEGKKQLFKIDYDFYGDLK